MQKLLKYSQSINFALKRPHTRQSAIQPQFHLLCQETNGLDVRIKRLSVTRPNQGRESTEKHGKKKVYKLEN